MNKHDKLTQKAISVAISLLTANFVFGIVPLNILPSLSQPVWLFWVHGKNCIIEYIT